MPRTATSSLPQILQIRFCSWDPSRCFKNYSGPSNGMEATNLAEGFSKSIEMHNLNYQRFIADGDGSTEIIGTRPYANVIVVKINCRNHILRRFCKSSLLIRDTLWKIENSLQEKKSMCPKYICDAIKANKTSKNYEKLHHDINNSVCHAFGKHARCDKTKCSETDEKVTEFDGSSLWQKIKL